MHYFALFWQYIQLPRKPYESKTCIIVIFYCVLVSYSVEKYGEYICIFNFGHLNL